MLRLPTALLLVALFSGCASITNDAFVPIAFSMSDGSNADCTMTNKRGQWTVDVPDTAMIRRSDDALKYNCDTENGAKAAGAIDSKIGAKIVASAVFIDFGITDAITDKHREYPASFVIPVKAKSTNQTTAKQPKQVPAEVESVAEAMMCSESIAFEKADSAGTHWKLGCGDDESLKVLCKDGTCYVR
ncbi:MAG: hypothetical protein AAF098_13500 [Pseudomonadota bacterium]